MRALLLAGLCVLRGASGATCRCQVRLYHNDGGGLRQLLGGEASSDHVDPRAQRQYQEWTYVYCSRFRVQTTWAAGLWRGGEGTHDLLVTALQDPRGPEGTRAHSGGDPGRPQAVLGSLLGMYVVVAARPRTVQGGGTW